MNIYFQKSWTASEECLEELKEIGKANGGSNMSATIRYCVRQVYKELEKERA
jgi:hypothetical protein